MTALLSQARAAGLGVYLCGSQLRIEGLDALPFKQAEQWCDRIRAQREEIIAALGGSDDPAGPILRQLGVRAVYVTEAAAAAALVAEIIANAGDGLISLDLEIMPIESEQERALAASHSKAQAEGRALALRKLNQLTEAKKAKRAAVKAKYVQEQAAAAGFDPHRAQIRLVQLYGGGERALVIDRDRVPINVLEPLWQRRLVVHNAAYELKHLFALEIEPARVECTLQAAGLLLGPHRRRLKDAALNYLGLELSKDLQTSDWSAPHLSQPQIHYAALDAVVTLLLARKLLPTLRDRCSAYIIQRDVLPAVARMELRGVGFDAEAHRELLDALNAEREELAKTFPTACAAAGKPNVNLPPPETPAEKRRLLAELLAPGELAFWPRTPKSSELSTCRSDLRRAAHYPPIEILARLSVIDKILISFGDRIAAQVSPVTGHLHASYNTGETISGRASCSRPNFQNLPRDQRFRSLFVAAPGRRLVIADWSSMELRAAAWISRDAALTTIFEEGRDPHEMTAAEINGIDPSAVTREQRQAAKALNFGSLYGMGPEGLRKYVWDYYSRTLTLQDAERQLATFKQRYWQFDHWRRRHADLCELSRQIRIGSSAADGIGRVFELAWNPQVEKQRSSYTQACNLPIQGACADASMIALTTIDAALRQARIAGGPVLWVHDEIVLEVPWMEAEKAHDLLVQVMVEAFLKTFPGAPSRGLVSSHVGTTWGKTNQ